MGQSRTENILENILGAEHELEPPQSRVEALLVELGEKIDEGPDMGEIEELIEEEVSEQMAALEALVGTPLVASTASDMTDANKIYVYVGSETGYTNGNWYYYNGSSWISGGVYNSTALETDTTLTVAGKAADAKATGDEISDLKEDLSQYINGIGAEYDIAQTGTNKINVLLIKGLNYTFTNKTTKGCTVNIYYADGSRTALSNNLAVNQSIYFTVSRDDAVAIGGWFDAVGTVEITTGYANLWNPYIKSLYDYTHLCRWEVGSVWGDNGKDTDIVTRGIRTINDTKIYVDSDCVARTINSSIETLYGFKYNLDGTYIERIGETGKTAIEIVGGYLYRFVLLAPTGTVITDTDIPQYSDNFGVYAKTLNEIMEKTEPEPTPRYIEGVSIGTDLIKRPIKAERVGTGTLYHTQAFLIYNGKYYSTNGTAISVQSKSFAVERDVTVSVGHGNAFSLGTGNKGYISGWDDNKVYVVNLDDLTIDSVINLPTTGYTTCAVDDVNGLLYIFQRDTRPNTESFYNLIVYDYVNEITKATYQTSIKFGAMQSCVLLQDKIIVLNGLGTPDIPNGYRVFDKTGNILAEYQFENLSTVEPEGVFVDSETLEMYISYGDGKVYNITFN